MQRQTGQVVGSVLAALARVRVVESALVLAAQAFLALFPLIIVVYAVAPPRIAARILDVLEDRFGLRGGSTQAINLLSGRDTMRGSLSVLGVVLVIGSATAFTRALQRVYERAWELPPLGVRGVWRWIAWLVGLVVYLALLGIAVHFTASLHVTSLVGTLFGLALWWWTPYLLLGGRLRWRALLPGAVLGAAAQLAVSLVSSTILPRTISSNETQFGPIGVVFAIESWLVIVAGALVASTAIGAALVRHDGPLGARMRGTPDHDGHLRRY